MNKYLMIMLIVGLVLVAGCTTQANQGQYDYVPYAGQGCGLDAPTPQNSPILEEDKNSDFATVLAI